MAKINLAEKFTLFSEFWQPKILGSLNDNHIKIAKFKGEFVWHSHDVDELFLVVKGNLTIKLRDAEIELREGELFVVPKQVEHMPVCEEECHVLLIEPKTTRNTGDVQGDMTVDELEWI